MLACCLGRERAPPHTWKKPRSVVWFEETVKKEWGEDDDRWIQHFRMPYAVLKELEVTLLADIKPHPLSFRKDTIQSFKCLCIAIFTLASCSEYRVVGELFGVSEQTVSRCTLKVCKALVSRRRSYIYMPELEEAILIAQRFEQSTGYPQAIGCIDGTHVAITPPEEGSKDFLNRKCYASYNIQAVCDDRMIFRDLCVKHPGSNHDAAVFRDSALAEKIHQLPRYVRSLNGTNVPLHILADPAYPMLPTLIKTYTGKSSTLPAKHESYNVYHSAARNQIERAFGRLKSRWRRIIKKVDLNVETAPIIITACFVLHNICERSTVCNYNDSWNYQTDPVLANNAYVLAQPDEREDNETSDTGTAYRTAVTEWLAVNLPLLKSAW